MKRSKHYDKEIETMAQEVDDLRDILSQVTTHSDYQFKCITDQIANMTTRHADILAIQTKIKKSQKDVNNMLGKAQSSIEKFSKIRSSI